MKNRKLLTCLLGLSILTTCINPLFAKEPIQAVEEGGIAFPDGEKVLPDGGNAAFSEEGGIVFPDGGEVLPDGGDATFPEEGGIIFPDGGDTGFPGEGGIVFPNGGVVDAIIKPEEIPPVADFIFGKESYIAGQEVMAINTSTAESSKQITQAMWMVGMNPATKTSKLENVFKTPKAGDYLISLKVKDNKGIWSEWTTKSITILPNEKPIITGIQADKSQYERGESINLTYTFENEEWEPIIKERWSYRGIDEAKAIANPMKPEQIFDTGEYIVSLTLEDKTGNISDAFQYTLEVNDKVQKNELRYKFETAWVGSIIDNMKNFNFQDYKEVTPESITRDTGKLIMSNSPEQVSQKGIVYQDTVTGSGRMIIHHLNNFGNESNKAENKGIVVLAENRSLTPVILKITNKSIKGPVYDVLTSGQEVLNLYLLRSPQGEEYTLLPGEKIKLYDSTASAWHQGRIISGLFDFEAIGDVTFTSAVTDAKKTVDEILAMPIVPRDGKHNRGTFDEVSRHYTIDLSNYDEPVKLLIGNGGKPEWVHGIDATTGEEIYNMGNYGLSHYVTVKAKEKTGVFLNPRGGVYRGTIGWNNGQLVTAPLYGSFTQPVRAATLGVVEPQRDRTFEYILPNGSAAPILFGFVPESYWDEEIGHGTTKEEKKEK